MYAWDGFDLHISFYYCITVQSVNTSIESSRDPPFYVGTSLNLTCKVDLPNTVDPNIIRSVELVKNYEYYDSEYFTDKIYFHPLRLQHSGVYQCRICLVIGDEWYSVTCLVGNETYITGKLNLHQSLLSVYTHYLVAVLDLPPPKMEISVEPLATVGSVRTINCSVSVVPYLITSPHVKLYGPDQRLLAIVVTLIPHLLTH